MSEATIEEVKSAFSDLREEVQKKFPDKEKIEKIDKLLDEYDAFKQKHLKAFKESEKAQTDLKERLDALELALVHSGQKSNPNAFREMPEYKSMSAFIIKGVQGLEREEIKALRTDTDTAGGFLVPIELDNEIRKTIVEISNVRATARVKTIAVKTLEMAIRQGIPIATFEGEAESGDNSQSDYSNETVTTFRHTFTTGVTVDTLMNAAFNMESEIMADAGLAFAFGEGRDFVIGDGFKKPHGFTVDPRVVNTARFTSGSGVINFDDVMLLTGDLKTGQNPSYFFNRRTLAQLRILKDGVGSPLWLPGMNGVVANTINGFNYMILNDMPDIASNAIPIAFADLNRGYQITDRQGLAIIRDDLTFKKEAIVEFTFRRWLTGQVILPEAIKLLKVTP